jgi:hypothetical protein
MTKANVFRDYALRCVKYSTVGLTAEQLVELVVDKCRTDSFYINNYTRKEIREAVATLINYPHIRVDFGYYYWED